VFRSGHGEEIEYSMKNLTKVGKQKKVGNKVRKPKKLLNKKPKKKWPFG
jgi:hypothetical protein